MTWFYKDGDQGIGPVSKDELMDLIKTKRIKKNTLVRSTKMNEWRTLSELIQAKSQRSTNQSPPSEPPQIPPSGSDNTKKLETSSAMTIDKEVSFQFKGTGSGYFKIWIINVLLSIITIGIYSAWAKVRRKQYFYGNTSITGATFRYLADPIKILKGRLILFFGFVVYSIINQMLPAVASILTIGLIFVLPWLVVRSLAFNACNSAWRNIRFKFSGTYGEAAKVFILWPIVIPFTLGFILPYVFFRQKKFVVENSAYGTSPFTFKATTKDYYDIALRFFFVFIVTGSIILIVSAILVFVSRFYPAYATGLKVLPIILLILVPVVYLYSFAYFSVHSSNLLYNSSALRKHGFKATMSVNSFALIVLTNTLATVLTLGLFHPFATVRAYQYKIQHMSLKPGGGLDEFVAAELKETNALGDELSDFLDFDFGL